MISNFYNKDLINHISGHQVTIFQHNRPLYMIYQEPEQ